MLVANDVSLTVCNCTIISATVSHNYSDIGTIKIDAGINSRHAQADTITNNQQRQINGFERLRTKPTANASHS